MKCAGWSQQQYAEPPSHPANAIRLDYRTTSKVCLVTLSAPYGHFAVVVVVVVSAIVDVDDQQKAPADVQLIYRVIGALSGVVATFSERRSTHNLSSRCVY